jgi:hypothetical protein
MMGGMDAGGMTSEVDDGCGERDERHIMPEEEEGKRGRFAEEPGGA